MNARIVQSALGILVFAASGCELVADFDRGKIPGNGFDSGTVPMQPLPDAGSGDASIGDAGEDDAGDDDDDAGR